VYRYVGGFQLQADPALGLELVPSSEKSAPKSSAARGEKRRTAQTPEQREAERNRSFERRQKMTPEEKKRESDAR
jgi:hypothetical protein